MQIRFVIYNGDSGGVILNNQIGKGHMYMHTESGFSQRVSDHNGKRCLDLEYQFLLIKGS
jgi:hypothetical protein